MASDNLAGRCNTELWVDLLTAWFQPRTWRSALYLLLGFPLGIAYFTFLVTGFTVGAGLIIIYAGIPVLAFTFMGAYFFCRLETGLAIELRGAGIIQAPAPWTGDGRIWARVKRTVADEGTWKGIFFLFAMFPIGIATFTIVVTMASVALGFATVLIWGAWSDWYVDWEFQAIVEGCEGMLETTQRMNMRACLTYRHEVMQTKTNRKFWRALGGV